MYRLCVGLARRERRNGMPSILRQLKLRVNGMELE